VQAGQGAAVVDAAGALGPAAASPSGDGALTYPIPPAALASFCARLEHTFTDPHLLGRSLTHRSWCAEHAGFASNERLEFLGDSVLGLVVTDEIYHRHPDAGEGQLSRIRASVVCAPALAEMAVELGLGEVLLLGKGEAASGVGSGPRSWPTPWRPSSARSTSMEAPDAAGDLVRRLVATPPRRRRGAPDHKSRLHELVAQQHDRHIRYEITEDGPEHDKTFRAVVLLDEEPLGIGHGPFQEAGRTGRRARRVAGPRPTTRGCPRTRGIRWLSSQRSRPCDATWTARSGASGSRPSRCPGRARSRGTPTRSSS
jgi:ribonuclease-3